MVQGIALPKWHVAWAQSPTQRGSYADALGVSNGARMLGPSGLGFGKP